MMNYWIKKVFKKCRLLQIESKRVGDDVLANEGMKSTIL
jgi:hypothetical protein